MAWELGGDTPELDTPNAEVASADAGNAQRALLGTPVATPPRTAEAEADDDIVELPPPAAGSKPPCGVRHLAGGVDRVLPEVSAQVGGPADFRLTKPPTRGPLGRRFSTTVR